MGYALRDVEGGADIAIGQGFRRWRANTREEQDEKRGEPKSSAAPTFSEERWMLIQVATHGACTKVTSRSATGCGTVLNIGAENAFGTGGPNNVTFEVDGVPSTTPLCQTVS